jgi:hypothetical protein
METAGDGRTDAVQSPEIEKVAGALVAAQGEMTNPPKTKTVYAGQKKYSFAPLPEIIDAVRPVLMKHGLAVVQLVRERTLETRLIHTSGQWIGAAYALPSLADSQDMGSAITYARRYSLCAILGIAGEDDEDGQAATEAERAEQEAKRKDAEKRLDAMKAKGQMKSAYDGKVLAPGESPLPAERATGGKRQEESPSTELRAGGKREAASGDGQKPDVRGQTPEGKTAGPAARALPGEKAKTPSPPPFDKAQGRPSPLKREGAGENALAGITEPLAGLMKKDGITPEELQAYYIDKGHFPNVVEPTALPSDYVGKLTAPENWKLAVAAIKGGK